MEIVRTSSFWRDLKGLVDYFDEVHAEAAAVRFSDAVDETIDFIADFPDLGSPWESSKPRREGMRWRLVKGFENYLVLYRRDEDRLYVTRVVDGRRNLEDFCEEFAAASRRGNGHHQRWPTLCPGQENGSEVVVLQGRQLSQAGILDGPGFRRAAG